jgi:hypothetical protein
MGAIPGPSSSHIEPRGAPVCLRSAALCGPDSPVLDLLDGAEDHRRGALDRPAHQVPRAVAVMYLGEPVRCQNLFVAAELVFVVG